MSSHLVHKLKKSPCFRCIYQTAGVHFVDRWQHGTISGVRETSKVDPSGQWLIFDHNNNFDLRVSDPKYSELKMIVYQRQELKKENKTSQALGFSSCFISCSYLSNIHLRWNLLKNFSHLKLTHSKYNSCFIWGYWY